MKKKPSPAGRRPETVKGSHLQPDCLVEIKPTGKTTGEIVWEWRSWDHLIQDRDKTKPNYGDVSEHPELFESELSFGRRGPDSALAAKTRSRRRKRRIESRRTPEERPISLGSQEPRLDARQRGGL